MTEVSTNCWEIHTWLRRCTDCWEMHRQLPGVTWLRRAQPCHLHHEPCMCAAKAEKCPPGACTRTRARKPCQPRRCRPVCGTSTGSQLYRRGQGRYVFGWRQTRTQRRSASTSLAAAVTQACCCHCVCVLRHTPWPSEQ